MSPYAVPLVLLVVALALTVWAACWWHARQQPPQLDVQRIATQARELIEMEWLRDEMDPSPQWQQLVRAMDRRPAPTRRELQR
jgi:hypothetical protein